MALKIIRKRDKAQDPAPQKIKVVNRSVKLKITALSPIHIGSGEVYEPMNFIIDNNFLYEFRDEDFFEALPEIAQINFMKIIDKNRSDTFIQIHKFVKDNKEIVKKIANSKIRVTKGLQEEYNKRVGKISQFEGSNRKVFNKFEIQKIQRKQIKGKNGYFHTGYIVGSSLKGAISTAYQEFIFKKEGESARKEKFLAKGRNIWKNIFQDFKVADSKVLKIATKIGFALNKERFEYDFSNNQNNIKLSTFIEVIDKGSEFSVDINYGALDYKEILESCNAHYLPIFKSILANETDNKDEFINEYLENKFFDDYQFFELKPNQYLIRVGKYSGARAVTVDGLREIQSKISGGGPRRKKNEWETLEAETTSWLFGETSHSNSGLLPFGWILCEVVV